MIRKPESCRPCILWEGGHWCGPNGFSLLEGDGSSGLMVIAEALGRREEQKGLPLRPDAKAGGVYQKALDVGKLIRETTTLTNIVRCFVSPKTSVFTPTGYVPMHKLSVGDEVLTHKGRFRRIIKKLKFVSGPEPVVKIQLEVTGNLKQKPAHVTVTLDHKFQCPDGSWVAAKDILVGDSLLCLGEHCITCNQVFFRGFTTAYKALPFCSNTCHNKHATVLGREKLSQSMKEQYRTGTRDPFEITKAAHEAVGKLLADGWKPFSDITEEQKVRRRASAALTRQLLGLTQNFIWIGEGERLLAAILSAAAIDYTSQFALGPYNYDFKVGSLIIEVDGAGAKLNGARKVVQPIKDKLAEDAGFKVIHIPADSVESALQYIQNDDHDYPFLAVKVLRVESQTHSKGVYSLQVEDDESYVAQGIVNHNCRPPGNELKGMPYERDAIDFCRQYLDAAVAERRPRLLLALGDVPLRELSLIPGGISELRGYVLPSRYNIPMIATYHPSHLARGAFGQLFGVFLHDIRQAYRFAQHGVPPKLETHYILDPTEADFRDYLDRLRSDITLATSHDIETPGILGEKEPEDWREKKIIQVQFSCAVGEAIVCDWAKHREFIQAVYALPNEKWGWNNRLSDRPCLKANGITINGEDHDLMNAFAHLQPNFVSGKDASDTEDKGVPARLMSLQSCVSFYYPQEGVWKGTVQAAVKEAVTQYMWLCLNNDRPESDAERYLYVLGSKQVQDTLRYYGARDADMTFRVGVKIFASLRKLGLW